MRIAVLLAVVSSVYGQAVFDAASVKPAPSPADGRLRVVIHGGPGSKDPGRWTCRNITLDEVLKFAFHLQSYELAAPAWTRDLRFDIDAKIPDGATRDELRKMVAHLLEERFGLAFHREPREMAVFHLVIAKGGPKLTETAGLINRPPAGGPPGITVDRNGYPEFPPGQPGHMVLNGMGSWRAIGESTETVAAYVAAFVHRPVLDRTGLKGKYDFLLKWELARPAAAPPAPGIEAALPAPEDGGPTMDLAIQEQLGLKLEPKKGTIDVLVVDRLDKTPTEN